MKPHHVGDRLVLGGGSGPFAAVRVEAVRPDGSRVERDWGRPPVRLRLDQPGTWKWRLYIRDEGRTRLEEGEIKVIASPRPLGRLERLLRRVTSSEE